MSTAMFLDVKMADWWQNEGKGLYRNDNRMV